MESKCCGVTDFGGDGYPEDSLRDLIINRLGSYTSKFFLSDENARRNYPFGEPGMTRFIMEYLGNKPIWYDKTDDNW